MKRCLILSIIITFIFVILSDIHFYDWCIMNDSLGFRLGMNTCGCLFLVVIFGAAMSD